MGSSEARIIATDGSGRILPPGDVGELQIRGPVTMREYLVPPKATAETFDLDAGRTLATWCTRTRTATST